MFDTSVPRVILGGKSGPMSTGQFADIVRRNQRVEDLHFRYNSRKGDALEHLCTVFWGNPNDGEARNVPRPVVPEFSDTKENGWVVCRGWRALFTLLVQDGWIYPSGEIRKWLGDPMWIHARSASPCR